MAIIQSIGELEPSLIKEGFSPDQIKAAIGMVEKAFGELPGKGTSLTFNALSEGYPVASGYISFHLLRFVLGNPGVSMNAADIFAGACLSMEHDLKSPIPNLGAGAIAVKQESTSEFGFATLLHSVCTLIYPDFFESPPQLKKIMRSICDKMKREGQPYPGGSEKEASDRMFVALEIAKEGFVALALAEFAGVRDVPQLGSGANYESHPFLQTCYPLYSHSALTGIEPGYLNDENMVSLMRKIIREPLHDSFLREFPVFNAVACQAVDYICELALLNPNNKERVPQLTRLREEAVGLMQRWRKEIEPSTEPQRFKAMEGVLENKEKARESNQKSKNKIH